MFCSRCGMQNAEGSVVCAGCGGPFGEVGIPGNVGVRADVTSGLAIASLVLGILSFFVCFTSIPGIICGIVALSKIKASRGQIKGNGLAIGGVVTSGLGIMVFFMLMAIMLPALSKAKTRAGQIICGSNLKQLSMVMMVYANDYEDKVPTHEKWCDLLMSETGVAPTSFQCPITKSGQCDYALNKNVTSLEASRNTVLLFETTPGWNQVGGRELLSLENHEGEGCNIVFVDGHTEFVRAEQIEYLKW